MEENIFDDLEIMITDRLNNAFSNSKEYKEAVTNESEMFEKLKICLSKQQQDLLNQYFELTRTTTAVCEIIAYKQGFRDFFKFLFQDK